jgi:hypothetical protein
MGLDTEHEPPSGVDVKNTWRCIPTFNMSSRRDKVNFEMYIYFRTSTLIFYLWILTELTFPWKPPAECLSWSIVFQISIRPSREGTLARLLRVLYFRISRYSDCLRVGRPRSRSSSPGITNNFYFSTSSRPALGSTQPPPRWIRDAFPGG